MKRRELSYYYALYMSIEHYDAANNNNTKKKSTGTKIPYGLCKEEGIKVPEGTKPSGAWKLLEGKTGVSAGEVFSKIKSEGTPKRAYSSVKSEKSGKSGGFKLSTKKGFADLPRYHGNYEGYELSKGYSINKGLKVADEMEGKLKHGLGISDPGWLSGYEGSMSQHLTSRGEVSKRRDKLHRAIIGHALDGVKKAEGKPTCTIMGGGPASGKSTVLHSGKIDMIPPKGDAVYVDADDIKTQIPEYQMSLEQKDSRAGAYCHEESVMVSKRLEWIARENGYNVVSDGTGDSSVGYMKDRIRKARNAGMVVNGLYCTCDIDVALDRSYKRFAETGRLVPDRDLKRKHASVSVIFPEIASDFDHVELWDTDGDVPIKIAECNRGEDIKVLDSARYKKFLQKGRYYG